MNREYGPGPIRALLTVFCGLSCIIASTSHLRDEADQISFKEVREISIEVSGQKDRTDHIFRESAAGLSSRGDILKKQRAAPNHIHEVMFAIQPKNIDVLTDILNKISDPDSDDYGQHKTREEIEELTSNAISRDIVLHYLHDQNVTVVSESLYGEYITAHAPIALWESMFNTEFHVFHHTENKNNQVKKLVRAEKYSIPSSLDLHVASVFHTVQMPFAIWAGPIMFPISNETSPIFSNVVNGFVTPMLLNAFYNIKSNIGSAKASQTAFETIGQYFSPADLSGFQQLYGLIPQPVTTFIGGHVDDATCVTSPNLCTEANLDIQYLMAVCQASTTIHWYTDMNSFADWLVAVANKVDPPLVISISYGATEDTVSRSEFDAFNVQAMKLGAMGITIVAASGGTSIEKRYYRNCSNCLEIFMSLHL